MSIESNKEIHRANINEYCAGQRQGQGAEVCKKREQLEKRFTLRHAFEIGGEEDKTKGKGHLHRGVETERRRTLRTKPVLTSWGLHSHGSVAHISDVHRLSECWYATVCVSMDADSVDWVSAQQASTQRA